MPHWRYPLNIVFSLLLIVIMTGCSNDTVEIIDDEITSIGLSNGDSKTYSIYINNEIIGTKNSVITTGILKTFNNGQYRCAVIEDTIETSTTNNIIQTFIEDPASNMGYFLLLDDQGLSDKAFIPFPIAYQTEMTGYFGIFSKELITVSMDNFHLSYTNKNGHKFSNVAELSSENEQVKIFVNETYFIIQTEDYRYAPTIESLKL